MAVELTPPPEGGFCTFLIQRELGGVLPMAGLPLEKVIKTSQRVLFWSDEISSGLLKVKSFPLFEHPKTCLCVFGVKHVLLHFFCL